MKGKGQARQCKPLPKESVAPHAMLLSRTENIAPMAATLLGLVLRLEQLSKSFNFVACFSFNEKNSYTYEEWKKAFALSAGPMPIKSTKCYLRICKNMNENVNVMDCGMEEEET